MKMPSSQFGATRSTALLFLLLTTFLVRLPGTGHSAEPSSQYLKAWLLCGPFPVVTPSDPNSEAIRLPGMYTDWLQATGGETNARPVAGQTVPFQGGACTWVRHVSPADAVDLDTAITKVDRVVAYAYAEIESPGKQACILALGSNDGVRAWLNGEPVLDCPGPRGLQMDHNLVPVALRSRVPMYPIFLNG